MRKMGNNGTKKAGWRNNKWIRAAIPALLLHCSIGTVYCQSIFSQEIADYIGFSKGATEWAFSFAIFFLGMSAAFAGKIVAFHGRSRERWIRKWPGCPCDGEMDRRWTWGIRGGRDIAAAPSV